VLGIDLAGRVAIVTGSTRGIGRSIAHVLSRAGARVVICARTYEHVNRTVEELGGASIAVGMQVDLRERESAPSLVEFAVRRHGRLDILVNNAVTSVQNTFEGLSDDDWDLHIQSKLTAYVRMCRCAIPHLVASGRGRIVNVAGMSARQVTDYRMTNGAVNAAVTNFSKHLAEQCGPRGITVNAIHPGLTWTPRLEEGLQRWAELEGCSADEAKIRREAEIPIGRFIRAEEIAQLVAFLASDLAVAITGQAIAVDGGSGRGISY
jgi:NAD(P)-dependent dehydrogenase (short-subunit alcohol dehydrogenase family)